MQFEFATAGRIMFGPGVLSEVGPLASGLGQRAFVVTGRTVERARPLLDLLSKANVQVEMFSVPGEPTIELAQRAVRTARKQKCDVVVAFGGGSVLDTGKAVAALVTNAGDPLEYLEVIGKGQPLTNAPVPLVAIPTTSGTGSEVTRNAVLASPQHRVKVSLRSPLMLPRVALVDPELTLSVPPSVTAQTGLDALTQVIEPFVSIRANPLTDALCREGMRLAARSLGLAYARGDSLDARADMSFASLCGGLALANAGLGAVHGFAGPLGGMFHAPHGAICGTLLPHVADANIRALRRRLPQSEALARYDEVARILTGSASAAAEDGVAWLESLCTDLKVCSLALYGVSEDDIPVVMEKAARASSMKGNPVLLTREEMTETLQRAL
jgi:alcohol dehydrogenase class IV